jgi:hypothetical protein
MKFAHPRNEGLDESQRTLRKAQRHLSEVVGEQRTKTHLLAFTIVSNTKRRIFLLETIQSNGELIVLGTRLKIENDSVCERTCLTQTANSGAACAQGRTLLMLIARETTAGGTNMDVSVHRVPVVNVSPLLQSMPKSAAISPDLHEVWTAHRVCVREPAVLRPY